MVDATEVIRSGAEFLGEVMETAAKGACRLAGGAWEIGAYRVAVAVVEASVAAAAAGVLERGAWGEAEAAPCTEVERVTCLVRVVLAAEVGAAGRVALGAARVAGVAVASTSPAVTSIPASLSATISATSAYWAFSGLGVLILS